MTYTRIKRTLLLVSCIMGLSSSILQAKYISGLLSEEAAGLAAGTDNLMTIDGIIDSTSLATLSGNAPSVTTIGTRSITTVGTSRDVTLNGFADLEVGKFTAASGAIVAAFNESAPAEADGGYVELDETTIVGGAALYAAGDLFIPGAIIKVGANYNILGSVREAGETESTASSLFLSQIVASTGTFTALNTGGSINIDRSDIAAAYNGGADNNALYTINAAVTDGTRIYVVGSILDDSSSTGTPNKAKAFIGAITASTGAWVTQTGAVDIIILSTANDIELLDLAYDTTNDILYVCGYDGDDAIVRAYTDNGSGVLTIAVTAAADTSSNKGFGTSGQYTYSPASGSSKAWAIKQLSSQGNLIVGLSNSIISNDPLEQSVTVLAVRPAAVNTANAGALNTGFSTDGIQTYTFSGIPSAYPHDFSLNYPSFSFENQYLSLQIGDSDAIFLCGSLSAYGMPFVYKLDADGVEQPFAPNFRYGIDTGNLTSAVLDPSPVLYPVMGYSWDTSLQGLFASAIDNTNGQLYLFGTSGNVQRSTSDDAFTLNSASDTVQQVPTGNLDLLTENNFPILRTASNTAGLTVTNSYNSSGVTLSANADGLALAPGIGGLFDTDSLYITIPSQTTLKDDFDLDEYSVTVNTATITEIYGSVDINGITIPLSGTGSITVADAAGDDFTTDNGTDITGTLRGLYNGGLVEITFTSATITDTASASGSNTITANLDFDYNLVYDAVNARLVVTTSALSAESLGTAGGISKDSFIISDVVLDVGNNSVPAFAQVDITGAQAVSNVGLSGLLTIELAADRLTIESVSGTLTGTAISTDLTTEHTITLTPVKGDADATYAITLFESEISVAQNITVSGINTYTSSAAGLYITGGSLTGSPTIGGDIIDGLAPAGATSGLVLFSSTATGDGTVNAYGYVTVDLSTPDAVATRIPVSGILTVDVNGSYQYSSITGSLTGTRVINDGTNNNLVTVTLTLAGAHTFTQILHQNATGNASIILNNTYDPIANTYSLSIDSSPARDVTGESPAAYAMSSLVLDTLEVTNDPSIDVFGAMIVNPNGAGNETVRVSGNITVTVASLKLGVNALAGAVETRQVVGYLSSGESITVTLDDGAPHVNTRAAQDITGEATLNIDHSVSAGVSAGAEIDAATGLTSTAISGGVTVNDLDLVNSINQVFTQKGQHKILISALLDITLPNSGEAISNIVITGYAPITVLQDYSITAQPFKMTGTYSSAGNGDITVTYWVNTITITEI